MQNIGDESIDVLMMNERVTPTSRVDFYQDHLDRVSRSFAFCIARLENPLREYVSLGYLLCRLLDTVEDAAWVRSEDQLRAFDQFNEFLTHPPGHGPCARWASQFAGEIPDGERALLADATAIFDAFHALPSAVQVSMRDPILTMSRGMRFYRERAIREQGSLRLRDLMDVNRYCFFVAGVVGEMLSRLLQIENETIRDLDLRDAYRFGHFLQKVNLLKDQASDERSGRFLVPSRSDLRRNLMTDAAAGFEYLRSIPVAHFGFRLFCAWSLFLGLASLPWIDRGEKISREETFELLARVEDLISQPRDLEALFEKKFRLAELSVEDLIPLYSGLLTPTALIELL